MNNSYYKKICSLKFIKYSTYIKKFRNFKKYFLKFKLIKIKKNLIIIKSDKKKLVIHIIKIKKWLHIEYI